jgi:hypothetical protein
MVTASVAILAASALPSFAADAAKEIGTAAEHAGYAAAATVINTTYSHLHHTINCLVGPGGADFDAKEANPCAAMGAGAIPDTTDAAKQTALTGALAKAKEGLAATDLATATADATAAQALLKGAM